MKKAYTSCYRIFSFIFTSKPVDGIIRYRHNLERSTFHEFQIRTDSGS